MAGEEYKDGAGYVLAPSVLTVLVNKLQISHISSLDCTTNINFGAGRFNLTAADPSGTTYLTINSGDEVEIYLNPLKTMNKVWGGYVGSKSLKVMNGQQLVLTGLEYSSRLLNQQIASYSTGSVELSAALIAIAAAYQIDFDTLGVQTTSGKTVNSTFSKDTIYNCMKKLCDQYFYYFGVDVDKHIYAYPQATTITSPDTLVWGDNVFKDDTLEDNKETLINDVTVQSTGAVSATSSDATSQSQYLKQSQILTVSGLVNNTVAQAYADTIIAQNKNPITQIKVVSKFLQSTYPVDYIYVNIPPLGLLGNYQVIEITHNYDVTGGVKTTTTLGRKVTDQTMWLGEMQKRLKLVESQTYTGA